MNRFPFSLKALTSAAVGSFLLAVIPFAYDLYKDYGRAESSISIRVEEKVDVLDVRRPIDQLQVLFRGREVLRDSLSLQVYRISLKNDGNVNILQNQYDQSSIWGLAISNGEVINIKVVSANDTYISDNINPLVIDQKRISFEKIIFEKEGMVNFEVLTLVPAGQDVVFTMIGKIAGISSVQIVANNSSVGDPSVFRQAFDGGASVQGIRLVSYFLGFLIAIAMVAVIIFVMSVINEKLTAYVRRRNYFRLASQVDIKIDPQVKSWIGRVYVRRTIVGISNVLAVIENLEDTVRRVRSHIIDFDPYHEDIETINPDKFDKILTERYVHDSSGNLLYSISLDEAGDVIRDISVIYGARKNGALKVDGGKFADVNADVVVFMKKIIEEHKKAFRIFDIIVPAVYSIRY